MMLRGPDKALNVTSPEESTWSRAEAFATWREAAGVRA
jgi:hypothetical protein